MIFKGFKLHKSFLLVTLFISLLKVSKAQDKLTGYLMPNLSFKYAISKNISQSVDIESRNFGYLNKEFKIKAKHVEFLNLTKFKVSENQKLGFGVSYRFQANEASENEFRLMQQYEWQKSKNSLIQHRVRVEERIYASVTKFRFRYKTGLSFSPVVFCDAIKIANEVMLETARKTKPEYEERLLAEAQWNLSKRTQIGVGTQYRFSDFTGENRSHNIFLTAGLTLNL